MAADLQSLNVATLYRITPNENTWMCKNVFNFMTKLRLSYSKYLHQNLLLE